jgi:uroporphyrinogen-III synthase
VRDAAKRLGVDLGAARWAAVGEWTARELRRAGIRRTWLPSLSSAEALAEELPVLPSQRVVLLRGSLADDSLPRRLRERGAETVDVIAYTTVDAPGTSRPLLERALAGRGPAAILFASPSAVHGLLALAGDDLRQSVLAIPAVAIGPTTAAAVRDAGFALIGQAETQDASALAELTAELVGQTRLALRREGVPA